MAIFTQIGGISTSSITNVLKGPLKSLFGKKTGMTSYQYPDDLTNDPSRMHFIQFDISNIDPIEFKSAGTALVNKAQNVVSKGETVLSQVQAPKKFSVTKVSLYMPDTLNMTYHNSYEETGVPASFKLLEKAGELANQIKENGISGAKAAVSSDPYMTDTLTRGLLGIIDPKGGETNADLALKAQGYAVNPQVQMIYKGNGFRKFQFTFIMTAKSQSESDQISAICNTFIFASSPSLDHGTGMYYIPPSIFNIKLMMSKNTDLSGFSAMLRKAGNSLIPGLNLGSIGGGTSSDENTRLFKVGDCVLESVNVDYAPSGWSAHPGGAPIQTILNLEFSEIHIVHRERLQSGEIR